MKRLILVLLASALLVPASASSESATPAAQPAGSSASIAYAGTDQTKLVIMITAGTEPVCQFLFEMAASVFQSGLRMSSVTGPGTTFNAQNLPNVGGFFQQNLNIQPGQSATLVVQFTGTYPQGAGARAALLPCDNTSAPPIDLTGPNPPPPPPPPPPCDCSKLSVKVNPTLLRKNKVPADKHNFGVGFTWSMTCTAGAGGCKGQVRFLPPQTLVGKLPSQRGALKLNIENVTVSCAGPCAKLTTGQFLIKLRSQSTLNHLYGRGIAFKLRLICFVGGKSVVEGTEQVTVRVDQTGHLKLA